MPAASTLKPLMLKYDDRSRTGGNIMGSGWNGRRCWAETRVASRVGGRDDSVGYLACELSVQEEHPYHPIV
jgi:hypothetical protein